MTVVGTGMPLVSWSEDALRRAVRLAIANGREAFVIHEWTREGFLVHTASLPMLEAMYPEEFADLVVRFIVDAEGFFAPLTVPAPEYRPEDGVAALARAREAVFGRAIAVAEGRAGDD